MSNEYRDDKPLKEEEDKHKAMREGLLRMLLTSEARDRLMNIRIVKPDFAQTLEDNMIRLASAGRLKTPVDDEEFKKILISIQKPKREFKIKRI